MLALRLQRWQAGALMALRNRGLSERERAILDFEGSWWKVATRKEQLIRERFRTSPERYVEELLAIIETEQAFSYHPFVVQRLRRQLCVWSCAPAHNHDIHVATSKEG